jgi:hypothetical protein
LDKDQVRYSLKKKFKSNNDSSNKERKCEDQNKNVILNFMTFAAEDDVLHMVWIYI